MPTSRRVPRDPSERLSAPPAESNERAPTNFDVELPGTGATIPLNTSDEVVLWEDTAKRYISDFRLTKTSDLIALGAILTHVIALYRAQLDLADPKKQNSASERVGTAAENIRKAEKALGIDKASRDRGGQQSTLDYVKEMKAAGYAKGVRISERVKAYEAFNMELKWKLRILHGGDEEDRAHHRLTPKSICEWAGRELAKIEEADKEWAKEKGAIWVGKL